MYIQIDKGHAIKGVRGASALLDEVNENRKIGNRLIEMLKEKGHVVDDVSCDEAYSVSDQLKVIVEKANRKKADLFCSIHLNAGGGHGTETYVLNGASELTKNNAKAINNAIVSSCGFRNRGVKEANFYVLRNTISPALLIEVCFTDSVEDKQKLNTEAVARAIFKGITGIEYIQLPPSKESQTFFRVVIGSYTNRSSAVNCLEKAKVNGFPDAFLTTFKK